MKNIQRLVCLITLIGTITYFLAGSNSEIVLANSTPQTAPFSQNWTDAGLITVNDDWAAVPGIVGYLGDIAATTTTNVDPRTLLLDYTMVSAVDVIANQTNPDTLTNGGVAEFAITNPSIALNGSGTADAPHIVIHLNTTGQGNINFTANIRDLDASADDAVQQIDVQYRVGGGTGNYTSVAGGYFADVTAANTATTVTPVNVTLPSDANNQPLVQIRVMTTNAGGNDEWVGIDDISVTASPVVAADAPNDANGDGRSDFVVVRNVGGGPGGQIRWFTSLNNVGTVTFTDWGIAGDRFVFEDFDGDNKDDITIWRSTSPTEAAFYILQSGTSTARIDNFGIANDRPNVVGDYDGDGKADVAVYRPGATAGAQSTWFYRGSLTPGNITYVPWGMNGDFQAPGDYDGDSKFDFVIQRNNGGGQARFWRLFSNFTSDTVIFGQPTDIIVPGDYDGDSKCDIATVRDAGGMIQWHYLSSLNGSINYITFGVSATDFPAQGDYDGDGKVDAGIWRPNADPTLNFFWWRNSGSGTISQFEWGQNGDYPVNNWNTH